MTSKVTWVPVRITECVIGGFSHLQMSKEFLAVKEAVNFIKNLGDQGFEKSTGIDIIEFPPQKVDLVEMKKSFWMRMTLDLEITKWFQFLNL